MSQHYFATCPRGLEALLAEEIGAAGARAQPPVDGGVAFTGSPRHAWRLNLESRFASRVYWQVAQGRYRSEQDIYRVASEVPWERWFDVEHTIRVGVDAQRSPLKSLEFVTLRIKDAVCDRFRIRRGARPSVDTSRPDMRIQAFLQAEQFVLYLDTSGDTLFKRGWRRDTGTAPLRENLAAGILALAGWKPGMPLFDGFCGSGTFLIEAAHWTLDRAPGLGRRFAFERFRTFEAPVWQAELERAQGRVRSQPGLPVWGRDNDAGVLATAQRTLVELGLDQSVRLDCSDVLDAVAPAESGLWVSNPPYGVRQADLDELSLFYPRLGETMKRRFAGWRVGLLSSDMRLPKGVGLKPARRIPLFNGPLECRLFLFDMVAGSLRRVKAGEAPAG